MFANVVVLGAVCATCLYFLRERPARTAECRDKIRRAIRCESLQAFQQHGEDHERSPNQERAEPSEADQRADCEIADEVVDLPTQPRAGGPIGGSQRSAREQDHSSYAA